MLIASMLGSCWLAMQIVHESGHVLAAWASGETIEKVVLYPWAISRTDVSHDRQPLLVIGSGPGFGALFPLALLEFVRWIRSRHFYLFQFFAGFCLIANGLYLGVGSFDGTGDAGDLLRYGCPRWILIAFGLVCFPAGLFLWNGLGPHFGLGNKHEEVDRSALHGTLGFLVIIVAVEILIGSR